LPGKHRLEFEIALLGGSITHWTGQGVLQWKRQIIPSWCSNWRVNLFFESTGAPSGEGTGDYGRICARVKQGAFVGFRNARSLFCGGRCADDCDSAFSDSRQRV
jgi:hypothetical protein